MRSAYFLKCHKTAVPIQSQTTDQRVCCVLVELDKSNSRHGRHRRRLDAAVIGRAILTDGRADVALLMVVTVCMH